MGEKNNFNQGLRTDNTEHTSASEESFCVPTHADVFVNLDSDMVKGNFFSQYVYMCVRVKCACVSRCICCCAPGHFCPWRLVTAAAV